MSHYSVAVFTKPGASFETLLEPYDENLGVKPYVYKTREDIIAEVRSDLEKCRNDMAKYANGGKEIPYWLTEDRKKLTAFWEDYFKYETLSDDEVIKKYMKDYEEDYDFDYDGNQLSNYNPDSKWDWYCVGGRWSGFFKNKKGEKVDECLIKDLDLTIDENSEEYLFAKRFWEVNVENAPLKAGEERKDFLTFYSPEYYKERYGNVENYCKSCCNFSTYAMVDASGIWHEPGQMGWFACDNSTSESREKYDKFFEEYLKNADPEWTITIVDCHI